MSELFDDRAESRRREDAVGGHVRRSEFREYCPKYQEHWFLERHDGVVEARMHTPVFSHGLRDSWWRLFQDLDSDLENEVLILSGTGDSWLHEFDARSFDRPHPRDPPSFNYDHLYYGTIRHIENLVRMSFPTIGVINGPGAIHLDLLLACDITLCAEDATITDLHFAEIGVPAGDGLGLILIELLGVKRAAHLLYTGEMLTAERAMELGVVNEVLTRDELLPRARAIAGEIMTKSRVARRLNSEIIRRRLRRLISEDLAHNLAHELYAMWNAGSWEAPANPDRTS